MSKTLFLLSSAINPSLENENEKEKIRIQETFSSINSINVHYRDCDIWMLDSGKKEINRHYYKFFPANLRVINFWGDKNIQHITDGKQEYVNKITRRYNLSEKHQKLVGDCYIKSLTESYVMKTVINQLSFSDYKNVIKLSGRYCLAPNHKKEFLDHPGKYTFSEAIPSNQRLCSVDYQYLTYLWGFCSSLQEDVKETINGVHSFLKESYDNAEVMDLEHSMFHNTKHKLDKIYNTKLMRLYARMGADTYIFVD